MTLVDIEPRTERSFRTLPESFCPDTVTYSQTSVSVSVTVQAQPPSLKLRSPGTHNGDLDVAMDDGIHVIAEVDSSGTLQKSYTWGPGIDNLLAYTDHTTTNTYYALTDHLGTIHAVTDESGSIVESYRFDAWGRVLGVYDSNGQPLSESAIGNNYLWQGKHYSWKTGLYFSRARYYDPVTGRFLSKDPIGISGGLNQFVYCGNNPVNYVDPAGMGPLASLARGALGGTPLGPMIQSAEMLIGLGTDYYGNYQAYGSHGHALNLTLNPATRAMTFAYEAIEGQGAQYYNSGDCLSTSERIESGVNSAAYTVATVGIAYGGAKLYSPGGKTPALGKLPRNSPLTSAERARIGASDSLNGMDSGRQLTGTLADALRARGYSPSEIAKMIGRLKLR